MDDERELRALLTQAADTVGVLHPPSIELMAHHQRRQRLAVTILAPACAVILVIAAAIALHARDSRAPAVKNGISQLRDYTWHAVPSSPLAARSGAATAWTGSALIFWGGQPNSLTRYFNDGAAYDPETKQWTMLPASPLRGRAEPISVWTGHDLFIWGGNNRSAHRWTDGALYDPSSRRWTTLPAAPMHGDYLDAGAYLIGSKVLLITVPKTAPYSTVDAALYDPASNTWQSLPSTHIALGNTIEFTRGIAVGNRLYLQLAWDRQLQRALHRPHGVAAVTFGAGRWTASKVTPPRGRIAEQLISAGSRVIQDPTTVFCGGCKLPVGYLGGQGVSTDPSTGESTPIPRGPLDRSTPMYVWTGAALLGIARTPPTGVPQAAAQGDTAAWDPATGIWTSLHSAAALKGADSLDARSGVWTGSSMFVWTDGNYPGHLTVLQFTG